MWQAEYDENKARKKKRNITDLNDSISSEQSDTDSTQENEMENFYIKLATHFDMYCPDKVPSSLRISTDGKNWSNAFILRFKESSSFLIKQKKIVEDKTVKHPNDKFKKKDVSIEQKLKFIVYMDHLSGIFSRSKLIMIQPFYIIKNIDENANFAVTQFDYLDNKTTIKPKTVVTFNWRRRESPEFMVIAIAEAASNTLLTDWSRKFKIDIQGQFIIKCPKGGSFEYVSVNVTHDENSPYYITIRKEDNKENLPLKIKNETKYEMNISQVFLDHKRNPLKNVPQAEVVTVKPCSTSMFAWDENCSPRYLKVQIEDAEEIYDMEVIKDLKPIMLTKNVTNIEHTEIKHYMRGYLKRRNIYDERASYKEEYCILNFSKQRLKIYNDSSYPTIIKLQNAQIDEDFQRNEFMLIYSKESYYFQCKNIAECKLWVSSLIKAKNLYQEDTIFVKTEPTEYSRVITFYKSRDIEREEEDATTDQTSEELSVYCVNIPKIIGVSVIDHNCKELLHIIIEKFFLKKTDIIMPTKESAIYMTSNIVQNNLDKKNRDQFKLLREYIQLSIDQVEIENQIDVAPFPILLSQRSQSTKHPTPFLNMEIYMKNYFSDSQTNKIKYISSVNIFMGELDLKVDDQTIQICTEMYRRLNLNRSQTEIESQREAIMQRFKPVYMKLEDKEFSNMNTSRIYIKRVTIEPINILLTFRSASKSEQTTITNNFFADFGLIFASIKDASIELEGPTMTHLFCTKEELIRNIVLYYKGSVMKQLYKVFGSFEIFGNPSTLFTELKKGFKNFFIVPFKELKEKKNLKIFGKKIASGTKSMVTSIVFGVVNAIVSIVESITRYIDYFTFDQKFRYSRQKLRDIGINGIMDGLTLGLKTLRFDAILSFYRIPRNIYLEKGFWLTVLEAPIKVILSTVFKPPLGVYDFGFCFIKGVVNTALPDYSVRRFRKRPPRIFGEDGLIIPYNYDHAVGNDYIQKLGYNVVDNEEFKYFDTGIYKVNKKTSAFAIILTDIYLYVVKIEKYSVKKFTRFKIHKLKKIKLTNFSAANKWATIDIEAHVNIYKNHNAIKVSKMPPLKAVEFVDSIEKVMNDLDMHLNIERTESPNTKVG